MMSGLFLICSVQYTSNSATTWMSINHHQSVRRAGMARFWTKAHLCINLEPHSVALFLRFAHNVAHHGNQYCDRRHSNGTAWLKITFDREHEGKIGKK